MKAFLRSLAAVPRILRDLIAAFLALAVALPLWVLPWGAACRLGRRYGTLVGAFSRTARRVGMINLRRAYGPEMSPARAESGTREVFANLGQSLAEAIQFARRFRREGSRLEDIAEAEDVELMERLLADPRPKVFVNGHLGSWEVATMMIAQRSGSRGAVIYRRVDNPFLDFLVRRFRSGAASRLIEKRGAVSESVRRLERGESVAVLLDESGGPTGLFLDFFGRPASTRKTAALLSIRTGAPIVVGAALRRQGPSGRRFLFKLALLEPPRGPDARPEAVAELTREILRIYEGWVREDPLQWRWVHWRWKHRPGGREETYTREDLDAAFPEVVRSERPWARIRRGADFRP